MISQLANLINSQRHLEKYEKLARKFVEDDFVVEGEIEQFLDVIKQKLQSPLREESEKWFEKQNEEETTTQVWTTPSQTETTFTPGRTSTMSASINLIAFCLAVKILMAKSLHLRN